MINYSPTISLHPAFRKQGHSVVDYLALISLFIVALFIEETKILCLNAIGAVGGSREPTC